jgi:hypothetical protein
MCIGVAAAITPISLCFNYLSASQLPTCPDEEEVPFSANGGRWNAAAECKLCWMLIKIMHKLCASTPRPPPRADSKCALRGYYCYYYVNCAMEFEADAIFTKLLLDFSRHSQHFVGEFAFSLVYKNVDTPLRFWLDCLLFRHEMRPSSFDRIGFSIN